MKITVNVVDSITPELERLARELPQATARAINRTAEQGRTAAVRDITGAFNLQAGFVRERIEIRKAVASRGRLEAALVVRGKERSLNLIRFAEKRVTLAEYRRRKKRGQLGVYVKVRKGGKNELLPGAFIGNSGRTVFRRMGSARLPIEPLQAIGVGQAMLSEIGRRKLEDAVRDAFEKNLRHEVGRVLARRAR
jgi:hypothetical protein